LFLLASISNATSFYDYSTTLFLISFNVNLSPYFPAKGDVLTFTEIAIIGGSILTDGITIELF
jgi:hypothetical protein